MTAFEFIKYLRSQFPCIPGDPHKRGQPASNGQLRRWLDMGAVRINGKMPKWNEEVEFPIWECVWFPKSKHKISLHYSEEDKKYSERRDEMEAAYRQIINTPE